MTTDKNPSSFRLLIAGLVSLSAIALCRRGDDILRMPIADALSFLPCGNTGPHYIDDARELVSWNAVILNSGPSADYVMVITTRRAR
jgi:hypothetical protein